MQRTEMSRKLTPNFASAGTKELYGFSIPARTGFAPPAEDASHGNVSAELMVERCTNFVTNVSTDREGHITDYQHNYEAGFCLGWVNASMVFLNVRDSGGVPALGVCLPEGIHTFEVIKSFLDYARANPDDLKFNPSFLIYWAMLEKHPCKK